MPHSMKPQSDFIELRSEEVQEILSRPPLWLLNWGTTIVFGVLALMFIGAWVVHYPDLIKASFKLTSANAPKAVLTHTDGRIIRLFAQEGQFVESGTVIAYLESTAHHDEIIQLSRELTKAWAIASKGNLEQLDQLRLSDYNQLGELQNAYQIFEQSRIQLRAYLINGFYSKKKAMLQQEIVDLKALAENLNKQHNIQEHAIKLAQEDYDIQRELYDQKVIARLDLKREESKYITYQLPYQQTASALISNLTAQRAKQKDILELNKQVAEERDKFLQALNTLQSETNTWKIKYIITAPVSGRVFFVSTLQENQAVGNGQELFYVAPPNTHYFGELRIPQQNAGKVQTGQNVIIKLAGFPYQEYGVVRGRIVNISNISVNDSVFLAKVALPIGLKTTYGKTLSYKTGMTASAEIITEDNRLFEKLFYQLRKVTGGR